MVFSSKLDLLLAQLAHLSSLEPTVLALDSTLFASLLAEVRHVTLNFARDVSDQLAVIAVGCAPVERFGNEVTVHTGRMPDAQDGSRRKEGRERRCLGERVQPEQEVVEGEV